LGILQIETGEQRLWKWGSFGRKRAVVGKAQQSGERRKLFLSDFDMLKKSIFVWFSASIAPIQIRSPSLGEYPERQKDLGFSFTERVEKTDLSIALAISLHSKCFAFNP
jgi:hypothetical protein